MSGCSSGSPPERISTDAERLEVVHRPVDVGVESSAGKAMSAEIE
jgi:hypothetical protein